MVTKREVVPELNIKEEASDIEEDFGDLTDAEPDPENKVAEYSEWCRVPSCFAAKATACGFCAKQLCSGHARECHLCNGKFCIKHWAPSAHKCRKKYGLVPEALPESVGVKALAAKEMVMSGITHERPDLLVKALRMMCILPPSKDMIAQSGLGFLLADETVWAMVEDRGIREKAQRLQTIWKKAVKEQHAPPVGSEEDNPLKGKTAKEVVELIQEWRDWAVVQMSVNAEETPHLRDHWQYWYYEGFTLMPIWNVCCPQKWALGQESPL